LQLDRLILYARNARTHGEGRVAQIAASVAELGFNNPVRVDERGEIIAGHARALVAEMKVDQTRALTIAREQARLALIELSGNLAQDSLGFKEAVAEGGPVGDIRAESS